MNPAGMVVSSDGQEVEVLVQNEIIRLGTIIKVDDFYGIVAHMSYREDEKIGSKQKLIANAQIFGRLDEGRLTKIKKPIEPYKHVYLAEDKELEALLSGNENVSIGLVYGTDARAFMDAVEFDRHIAILASTGAGKSYAAAKLMEEFASKSLPVLVIDTHGEYQRLLSELIKGTNIDLAVYTVKHPKKGFRELKIPVSDLYAEDFSHFISLNDNQMAVLERILNMLQGRDYVLKDIIDACDRLKGREDEAHEETIKALKRRLSSLEIMFSGVFDSHGTDITKIIQPYQITIIDVSYAPQGVRQSVVSYLAKELLAGRIRKENSMSNPLEYKLLFVVEEAHNYASSSLNHSCKHQLQRIASEGRKFGIGLCVISQKPSKIDEEILSQCNTGIYMHIMNPNDKEHIKKSFEAINEAIVRDLDSLDIGECIIAGAMSRIPFIMCKVDKIDVEKTEKRLPKYEKPKRIEAAGFDYV